MNLPSYSVRYLIKILSYAKGGMEITKEEATKGLGFLSPRKASPKSKATRARQRADDERKRQLRAAKSTELHRAVMARGGWPCELGAHVPRFGRVEMHHLKAGSAKRFYESVENCIRACTTCHRTWDNAGREQFRERVLSWCAFNSYPTPPYFLRAPHAKVPAPQAPESLPERIAK